MPLDATPKRPVTLAVLLIVLGVIGWFAAFTLTVEKFEALENPGAALGCDFSLLVQCSANLDSWQGSLLGFPNPILGLAGWIAPIAVGVALLAGARFDRWFWITFNVGVAAALGFVIWLISQSIFVLGTLCPWCMLTWSVTIPLFWLVTLRNLREGVLPASERIRRIAGAAYGWIPFITVVCYLVIAIIAQVRLDVLSYIL
ncbi:vitamin K epoxide reductase family protein [Microbacteriaceae bacterium VKM Ac-2854]|nr:vitamin K epoxide reductase family protein [Microbacteriaceae bacterium VKM Ac-2854]